MKENRRFTILLTGEKDNDEFAVWMAKKENYENYMLFTLPYTQPYENFNGIRELQTAGRFRAFWDDTCRKKIAVIDISEWIGHEEEEYFVIFAKFLCDFPKQSFFDFEYIFTVSDAGREEAKYLYRTLSRYLDGGRFVKISRRETQDGGKTGEEKRYA